MILGELSKRKIADRWNLACALSTVLVETASTLEPIREYGPIGDKDQEYFRKLYWLDLHLRKELGNVKERDSWEYCGRGFIQLTGHNNYERMGKLLNLPLLANPELMLSAGPAAQAFAAFWDGDTLQKTGITSWPAAWARKASEQTDPAQRDRCLKNVRICVNGGTSALAEFLKIANELTNET